LLAANVLAVMLDNMDNAKSIMPHTRKLMKDWANLKRLKTHITGVLVQLPQQRVDVWTYHDEVHA
jgi:hypothetical protein